MNARERVDCLSDEQIRDVLVRIVETVEANDLPRKVARILDKWSLLEDDPGQELDSPAEETS